MKRLNPEKLFVEIKPPITTTEPIIPRRYTLTHSDKTAELFLTVGSKYAYEKITSMRDEVLAEWQTHNGSLYLYVYLFVGNFEPVVIARRDAIFRRELPLALEAIIYGDRQFFTANPNLNNALIWVHFASADPNYNRFECWGTPGDYK